MADKDDARSRREKRPSAAALQTCGVLSPKQADEAPEPDPVATQPLPPEYRVDPDDYVWLVWGGHVTL